MADRPDRAPPAESPPATAADGRPPPAGPAPAPTAAPERPAAGRKATHEVVFVAYPKLLFIWPLIVAGLAFWPLGYPARPPARAAAAGGASDAPAGGAGAAGPADPAADAGRGAAVEGAAAGEGGTAERERGETTPRRAAGEPGGVSGRLEVLGWIYLWLAVLVLLAAGVDVDRNMAAFLVILVLAVWLLGLWLQDAKGFTFFGDIYGWFARLDVQYDRSFGLALSIVLLVPYALMLLWARLNDRWRITHNEFEHYAFGKSDDSLGRGAKTIRTSYPDVFELLLGLAGTLVVHNATGTRELRRIPHVVFLPFVRRRLNRILETVSVTPAQLEEEEEEEVT